MKNLILTVFLFSNIAIFSQENTIDTILVNKQNLDEVVVTAIRASSNNPVPFKVLDADDISKSWSRRSCHFKYDTVCKYYI